MKKTDSSQLNWLFIRSCALGRSVTPHRHHFFLTRWRKKRCQVWEGRDWKNAARHQSEMNNGIWWFPNLADIFPVKSQSAQPAVTAKTRGCCCLLLWLTKNAFRRSTMLMKCLWWMISLTYTYLCDPFLVCSIEINIPPNGCWRYSGTFSHHMGRGFCSTLSCKEAVVA